jgi:hypothetical protein
MSELVIQYVPHIDVAGLSSEERIKKLLKIVREEKIVLLEGRLSKQEEASLIAKTMESIDKKFKGIELAVIQPVNGDTLVHKVKSKIVSLLLGQRDGLTIIGPATIVREIKQDPNKIQLMTIDKKD